MTPTKLNTTFCTDTTKIEIVAALADAHRLINDDGIDLYIRDTLFALSHVIVDLIEKEK
jgi:hypothetical protein